MTNIRITLATAAVALLISASAQAAPLGTCTLKPSAAVKTLPSDKGHDWWQNPVEYSVAVRDVFGAQWVWIENNDSDEKFAGWTRRSFLKDCTWNGPKPKERQL
jgi:hypothetical protein